MRQTLILCLLFSLGLGQSSHRSLTGELLKNLYKAVSDSTSIPDENLSMRFVEDSILDTYLNSCLVQSEIGAKEQQVEINARGYTISINIDSTKTVRNSRYLRQLELNVLFSYDQKEFVWRGKISDNLSKGQLKNLLEEEIPFEVQGDYAANEPQAPLILLTTAGVFALGAALFFIRT